MQYVDGPIVLSWLRLSWWATEGPNGFQVQGRHLVFSYPGLSEEEYQVEPDRQAWEDLRRTLEAVHVETLPSCRAKRYILDGSQYSLRLEWGPWNLLSHGQLADEPANLIQRIKTIDTALRRMVPSSPDHTVSLAPDRLWSRAVLSDEGEVVLSGFATCPVCKIPVYCYF